jgi:DNA uptake protein ComE-like DNA-binding protein
VSGPGEDSDHRYLTLFAFLWLVLLGAAAAVGPGPGKQQPPHPARATINPNVAPPLELTILPRIGEATAAEIVHYREGIYRRAREDNAVRAFTCPADLARVRGIGPKTVRRITSYLSFGED